MWSKINEAALERNNDGISIADHSANDIMGIRALSLSAILLGSAFLTWAALEVMLLSEATAFAKICLPFATGVALLSFGAFAGTKWLYFVGWAGVALVGQAAALQMIDAGRLIHFQHYRPIPELFDQNGIALSFLALQTICVGFGLWPRLGAIHKWLQRWFATWQLMLIFVVLSLSSAAVTPNPATYITSLGMGTFVQLVNIANIILLAWSVPASTLHQVLEWINKFLGNSQTRRAKPRIDRFSMIAGFAIVVLTASLSYFVYEGHPHVPDESQYLFQAKYMAAGQLTVKAPLVPEAFSMYMVPFQESRWFGLFPPAWPAMLAVGTLVGASWLVNPLLSGLCVLLAYLFFQELYSRRFARIAILLLCCSPWFIFMGMSFMSHIATLVLSLTAILLLMRGRSSQNIVYSLAAGFAIGIISLIRPLDAAIVGVLLAIWALFGHSTWRARISTNIFLVLGTAAAAVLVFPYNRSVTGNALLLPFDAYYNKYFWPNVTAFGFGPERECIGSWMPFRATHRSSQS